MFFNNLEEVVKIYPSEPGFCDESLGEDGWVVIVSIIV